MMRITVLACLLALASVACGSTELSLSEYATEVESLVAEMETDFAAIDAQWLSEPPSPAAAAVYWEGRMEIRNEFLDAIQSLEPPEDVVSMHDQSVDVFTRITNADEALRARVETFETIDDHWQWVDTPEGRAADAVLADVYAFCRESQEEFDATKERESFDEMPWIPADMKEVVRVAFGCPPSGE